MALAKTPSNKQNKPAPPPNAPAEQGNGGAAPVPDLGKDTELKAYRDMLLIRRFEEKAGQMYGMGLIGGFCHLYIGQEAIAVGVQAAHKPGDQVITGYREKPTLRYDVSMGIYVYEAATLQYLPTGPCQFPNLVARLIDAGQTVAAYRSDADWFDIGTFAEYERALRYVEEHPAAFAA